MKGAEAGIKCSCGNKLDFRGEVHAEYECKKPYSYFIHKGDRIAQMLIEKVEDVHYVEVNNLVETERGTGGWGSTGR